MGYTAAATDAPDWQMAVSIWEELIAMRSLFVSIGDDKVNAVQQSGIIIRKTSDADATGTFASEVRPGLIVTQQGMQSDPNEGSNDESQNVYAILIQIVDADQQDKSRGLRTYSKWANLIARRMNDPQLVCIDPATEGVHYEFKHSSVVDAPDRRQWIIDKNFKRGVLVQCTVRESYLTEEDLP